MPINLDAPLAELTTNGQQGTLRQFMAQGSTLWEIAADYTHGFKQLIGTPDTMAAQMDEIMQEVGADGFVISEPLTRRYLAEITDGFTPPCRSGD